MWLSKALTITGAALAVVVVLLTLRVSRKSVDKPHLWIKSISVIATCLVLCAGGAVIGAINIFNLSGNYNNSSVTVNIERNDPESKLQKDEPVPDLETVDSFPVGWSDSNGGRTAYTLSEVDAGALDDAVVFNSISDGEIGHEFNFVGARVNNGEPVKYWNANEIEVEAGQTYVVRLFAHNNSRIAENVATGVQITFSISDTKYVTEDKLYEAAVHGYLRSSNSDPEWVSDGVKFTSDRPFRLVYIAGTALFENNDVGSIENGGYKLDNSVVGDWVTIGYDAMDGMVPACYQYSSVTTIKVMPVFDD